MIDEKDNFYTDCKAYVPFIVPIISDHLEPQNHEEWYCPLCLQEDMHANVQYNSPTLSPHYLDEWGCSASSPWLLHPTHSTQSEIFSSSSFSSRRLIDALAVLATCQKSCFIPIADPSLVALSLSQSHSNPQSLSHSHNQSQSQSQSMSEGSIQTFIPWTFKERISVLTGLCEVLKASPEAAEMFMKVNLDCQKLWAISAKSSFREADFMKVRSSLCVCCV